MYMGSLTKPFNDSSNLDVHPMSIDHHKSNLGDYIGSNDLIEFEMKI